MTADHNDMLDLDILIEDELWGTALPSYDTLVPDSIHAALRHLSLDNRPLELSVVLTNDVAIQLLNKTYRDKDRPTNVLSFPQDDDVLLGDIILALETIEREARQQNKSLKEHFQHLLIHGFLHLLGYDHEEDSEAQEMEGLEILICSNLGIKNPYESGNGSCETVP